MVEVTEQLVVVRRFILPLFFLQTGGVLQTKEELCSFRDFFSDIALELLGN
jgi:hypothetical protein